MSYDEHLIGMAGGDGDILAEIEARANAASEGPWDAARGANTDGTTYATTYAEKTEFLRLSLNSGNSHLWLVASDNVIPAATGDGPRARANAEFIAHAREDVPALLAIVREQAAKLAAVEAVAADLQERGEGIEAKGSNGSIVAIRAEGRGNGYIEAARSIRAALEPTP